MMTSIAKFFTVCILFICASCSQNSNTHVQGYIEGEYIYITSTRTGKLISMNVERGQAVKQGDLLFYLDPEPESDEKAEAVSNIEQLKIDIVFNKQQLDRQQRLYNTHATEKYTLDLAQRNFDSKTEELMSATAKLKQADWALRKKTFYAPLDSDVADIYFRLGENVPVGEPVLSLFSTRYVHVLFYIPETVLSETKIGQTISFTCDGCKVKQVATISYISPESEYTPPILYSKDSRYKLVYLVRAHMSEAIAKQFHPGQPVDVSLHE